MDYSKSVEIGKGGCRGEWERVGLGQAAQSEFRELGLRAEIFREVLVALHRCNESSELELASVQNPGQPGVVCELEKFEMEDHKIVEAA